MNIPLFFILLGLPFSAFALMPQEYPPRPDFVFRPIAQQIVFLRHLKVIIDHADLTNRQLIERELGPITVKQISEYVFQSEKKPSFPKNSSAPELIISTTIQSGKRSAWLRAISLPTECFDVQTVIEVMGRDHLVPKNRDLKKFDPLSTLNFVFEKDKLQTRVSFRVVWDGVVGACLTSPSIRQRVLVGANSGLMALPTPQEYQTEFATRLNQLASKDDLADPIAVQRALGIRLNKHRISKFETRFTLAYPAPPYIGGDVFEYTIHKNKSKPMVVIKFTNDLDQFCIDYKVIASAFGKPNSYSETGDPERYNAWYFDHWKVMNLVSKQPTNLTVGYFAHNRCWYKFELQN